MIWGYGEGIRATAFRFAVTHATEKAAPTGPISNPCRTDFQPMPDRFPTHVGARVHEGMRPVAFGVRIRPVLRTRYQVCGTCDVVHAWCIVLVYRCSYYWTRGPILKCELSQPPNSNTQNEQIEAIVNYLLYKQKGQLAHPQAVQGCALIARRWPCRVDGIMRRWRAVYTRQSTNAMYSNRKGG